MLNPISAAFKIAKKEKRPALTGVCEKDDRRNKR